MDELLQKAFERRELLRRELAAVDAFIHSYSPISVQRSGNQSFSGDLFSDHGKGVRKRSEQRAKISAAMDAAERAILEAGRPLTRSQLVAALEKAGHEIEGTDKNKVLGTNLWRSKKFINLKKAGYWPLSVPLPDDFKRYSPRSSQMLGDEE